MSKSFRSWDVDQSWLLPPSVDQFVPPGHLAHFARDTVREMLDLSAIVGVYKSAQGQPPYHGEWAMLCTAHNLLKLHRAVA
jgi:hypothetical protein